MKNNILLVVFVCIINFLFCNDILGQTPQPTGTIVYYYCIGDSAPPLVVGGTNILWYTTATGGTGSSTAPTPSTSSAGSTNYYVTQTIGTVESTPRKLITVNVDKQFNLVCGPKTINTVNFDFANVGQTRFDYSYTIIGSSSVSGQFPGNTGNFTVNGVREGQSVEFTITAVGAPACVRNPTLTLTCTALCSSPRPAPNFAAISPICFGDTRPVLQPTSPNGILGTWSPAVVSNTTDGSYVFTPDPIWYPCATTQTLNVTVKPLVATSFTSIPLTVCQGATYVLPTSSNNTPPITGTWSPSSVNSAVLGPVLYTFTPAPGQCTTSPTTTATITVIPNNVMPTFSAVGPICSGDTLAPLPTISIEGISGTWSPAINNTATTTYTFTPAPGQCALNASMTITVNSKVTPTFTAVSPICSGDALVPLPTLSNNGYTGSWSPAIDNTTSTTYTFTPDLNQCANTASLTIDVNPIIQPIFSSVPRDVCENSIPPNLPLSSDNTPSITGTWNPSTVDTSLNGPSDYVFTPDAGQCASVETITINVNPVNAIVDFNYTITEPFADNQMITITPTPAGNYLYQLDNGPFQTSSVFQNVSLGLHSVTVKDIQGCSVPLTKTDILVIGYPKFFTPNGDGYNDNWNISTLQNDIYSLIFIFDRYGKLLKEISPSGNGWDGFYNGQAMPAADYWFVVEYTTATSTKKYKSHFSLKR